jgi:hypothetical protein
MSDKRTGYPLPDCMMPDGAEPCAGYRALAARLDSQGEAIAHQREELQRLRRRGMQAAAAQLREPAAAIFGAIFGTGVPLSMNDVVAICNAIADVLQAVPTETE